MKTGLMTDAFGPPLKEEGAPIDPIEAVMFTGPRAMEGWFKRQCHAYFDYKREQGYTEEELKQHPHYIPEKVKE
jgi:hypothetical protein